jgi:hypothetical protein
MWIPTMSQTGKTGTHNFHDIGQSVRWIRTPCGEGLVGPRKRKGENNTVFHIRITADRSRNQPFSSSRSQRLP